MMEVLVGPHLVPTSNEQFQEGMVKALANVTSSDQVFFDKIFRALSHGRVDPTLLSVTETDFRARFGARATVFLRTVDRG